MSAEDRFVLLLSGLLAIAICVGASQIRGRGLPGAPDRPQLGRSVDEVAGGPDPTFPRLASTNGDGGARSRRADLDRVAASVESTGWPAFAAQVILHPISGESLPGTDLESGPPFHVVVLPDGSWEWTSRARKGEPASPEGLPVDQARRALHLALLRAEVPSAARESAVRAWWLYSVRRLRKPRDAVVFADEVHGSTVEFLAGFDRAPYVPAADTLAEIMR